MKSLRRNNFVGEQLGQGRKVEESIADMNMVAEGVKTPAAVIGLARRHEVEMPISEEMHAVLYEGGAAVGAYSGLQTRKARHEGDGV